MSKQQRSYTPYILLVLGALLLFYSSAKAYLLSFTHDESQTFLYFIRKGQWWLEEYNGMSANNHPLNSLFAIASSRLFGNGELTLRLPNVLAHAGYLYFTARIALRYKHTLLIVSAFLLLNVNPFVVQFFSLARGYGLCMCFLAGSLYYLSRAVTEDQFKMRYSIASLLLCIAGVFANFTLMNYLAALTGVLVIVITLRSLPSSPGLWLLRVLLVTATSALVTVFLFPVMNGLKEAGTLFYGSDNGFWTDTVNSLILATANSSPYTEALVDFFHYFIVIILAAVLVGGIIVILRRDRAKEHMMMPAVLLLVVLCVGSVIAQHELLGTKYLLDRTGLFFIPLFMLLLCELLHASWKMKVLRWMPVAAAIFFTAHFLSGMNLRKVAIWDYDADTKAMMSALEEEHKAKGANDVVTLGATFIHEPAITYYQVTRNLSWLNKVNVQSELFPYMDYTYLPKEVAPSPGTRILHTFISNNTLYRNDAACVGGPVMQARLGFEKSEQVTGMSDLNTSELYALSGKRAGTLDPNGYSPCLADTLRPSQFNGVMKLHIKAMIYSDDQSPDVMLAVSTDTSGTPTSWGMMPLLDQLNATGKWTPVSWITFAPKPLTNNNLRIYLMGNKSTSIYIDDLQVTGYSCPLSPPTQ